MVISEAEEGRQCAETTPPLPSEGCVVILLLLRLCDFFHFFFSFSISSDSLVRVTYTTDVRYSNNVDEILVLSDF